MRTMPISRFTQNYAQRLREVDGRPLLLTQSNGRAGWVLEPERRYRAGRTALECISFTLPHLLHQPEAGDLLAKVLMDSQPWTTFLPAEDRRVFAVEAMKKLAACASLGDMTAFEELIEDWRNTAEIHADRERAATLSEPIEQPLGLPVE